MTELEDDREFEQLASLLSVYRCNVPRPDFSRVRPMPTSRAWPVAIAAAILIAVIGGWFAIQRSTPRAAIPGEWIRTDAQHVQLRLDAIGTIDVGSGTTLRVDDARHLSLIAGTIHARTTAAPGVFIVDTPHARAVDLGCEYFLTIAADGSGILTVAAGWVALNALGAQSLVPQGASARIASDGRLAAATFDDAPPEFRDAVRRYSLGSDRDLATILALARRRDAFTLLNLFRLASADDRVRIYDRLNQLVPAPAGIAREAMRDWVPKTTEQWWPVVFQATGLRAIKKPARTIR